MLDVEAHSRNQDVHLVSEDGRWLRDSGRIRSKTRDDVFDCHELQLAFWPRRINQSLRLLRVDDEAALAASTLWNWAVT
jgi:hypothetical protein